MINTIQHKCLRLAAVFLSAAAFLIAWTIRANQDNHYDPDYPKENLAPLLSKPADALTDEDYRLLFYQTGLARPGVSALYEQGRQALLLSMQRRFFADVQVTCHPLNLLFYQDYFAPETVPFDMGALAPDIRDGDILVTFASHLFGWRFGHTGLVIDAAAGVTIESANYRSRSACHDLADWNYYPQFAVLRPKNLSEAQRTELIIYAKEQLLDLPYSFFSFVTLKDGEPDISTVQCAHLVWAAYKHIGIDLNSDGWPIVMTDDIFASDQLEIVQIYGMDPHYFLPEYHKKTTAAQFLCLVSLFYSIVGVLLFLFMKPEY